ncbi:MAG: Flp pilus assembly complex ATPase component TadA [Phycisphaeraceae bacterium]|nr:Flp pilus assembly complex ATPase component TadA [Phycisphaeraceae bacterium]
MSETLRKSRASQPGVKVQLGELLVERGLLSEAQLRDALEEQKRCGHRKLLGEILIDLSIVSEEQVVEALASAYGVPYAKLTPRLADPRVTDKLPRDFMDTHCVLPLFLVNGVMTVAISEPANLFLIEELERLANCEVQIVAATSRDIRATLQAHMPAAGVFVIDDMYDGSSGADTIELVDTKLQDLHNMEEIAGQSPVIKLVNFLLYSAVQDRASDIHIEREDHACRVRFRVDGRLHVKLSPPHQMHPAVVSRIKIMSGMDISERRLPQDGDIHVMLEGRPIDMRVSTMPGKYGEKVVIRVIDNRNAIVSLEKLGMSAQMTRIWREVINSPTGAVLVTGPTGSGKSTTLYSVLAELASDEDNLCTVENPVEANILGVNQFQVNEKIGFSFAAALRSLLRQDPDIIMVGEIRDAETAQVATQAALTGHLVLSTLHTNDAASAVTRLVNMGVEPYLVSAMLRGVLAQRLVRKVCPHCRVPYQPDARERKALQDTFGEVGELVKGAGCTRCRGKGYSGRLGVFELIVPNEEMLEAIARGAGLVDIRRMATEAGFVTLRQDGLSKALAGQTTVDEVLRVLSQDIGVFQIASEEAA